MKILLQAVAILAGGKFLFAIQDVIIKEMSSGYPVHEILSARGLVAIPIVLALIFFTSGLKILGQHRPWLHFLRGFLMFLAFMTYYVALSEISLTTATALFFTAPFFITLCSIPLLGERVGVRRFSAIGVGFIGVLIVLRPADSSFSVMMLLPIVSALFYAGCQLMIRYANMTAPASVMSLYASVVFVVLGCLSGLIFSTIEPAADANTGTQFLLGAWQIPNQSDLILMILTGVTSALGFMASSKAYQMEQASRVSPFEYVMIIWVTILSYLVWNELPDAHTTIGVVLIICSGLYVLGRESNVRNSPAAYSGLRRRL